MVNTTNTELEKMYLHKLAFITSVLAITMIGLQLMNVLSALISPWRGTLKKDSFHSSSLTSMVICKYRNLSVSKPINFSVEEFYSNDFVQNPKEANRLSGLLTSMSQAVEEAKRVQMIVYTHLLGKYKYAMLFDWSLSNIEDHSATSLGMLLLLRKLNIELVFSCESFPCHGKQLDRAVRLSSTYSNTELVILLYGAGKEIGMPWADKKRYKMMTLFPTHHVVLFPQSITTSQSGSDKEYYKNLFARRNVTIVWRDKNSYKAGTRYFPNVESLLAPDTAYQIGSLPRFILPDQNVLWAQYVNNKAEPGNPFSGKLPPVLLDYQRKLLDWFKWSPKGSLLVKTYYMMLTNGMIFLQKGKVAITETLHGHFLCTILRIPHVYITNSSKSEVSNDHYTWTASVENIVSADSGIDALVKAQRIIDKLAENLTCVE